MPTTTLTCGNTAGGDRMVPINWNSSACQNGSPSVANVGVARLFITNQSATILIATARIHDTVTETRANAGTPKVNNNTLTVTGDLRNIGGPLLLDGPNAGTIALEGALNAPTGNDGVCLGMQMDRQTTSDQPSLDLSAPLQLLVVTSLRDSHLGSMPISSAFQH